jgi:hypothetical protein
MKATTILHFSDKARVFIVEDSAERIRWFTEKLGDRIVGCYKDTEQAKQALHHLDPFSLDAVFLDHDLGFEQNCYTSVPVAKWLSDRTRVDPTWARRVIIHSYNESGSKRLQSLLPGSAIIRFGAFDIQVEKA